MMVAVGAMLGVLRRVVVRLFINELFEHLDFPKPDNLPAVSFAQ